MQQYLRGIAEENALPLERVAGCAFDGSWLIYVTAQHNAWNVQPPVRVDLDTLGSLVDVMESLSSGRGLTIENLREDFGRDSECAKSVVQALSETLATKASPRTHVLFAQWALDIGNASGFSTASNVAEWAILCEGLGVSADGALSSIVLFALQTYFALVARLFALVVLEGATGAKLMSRLSAGGSLWAALEELERGELTRSTYAANVIEPGIFSWYVAEYSMAVEHAVARVVSTVGEYSAEVVEITPTVARDVFKSLYQELVPRTIRHRLGEFYTPDWLAAYTIDLVDTKDEPITYRSRVLDPACGSGTFLIEVLNRILQRAADVPAHELLSYITQNVVGFDLSPLAVQAARVNYLLALAPLIRKAQSTVALPVFLADSVSPPRHGGLLDGDVLTVKTAEGEWRIPTAIMTHDRIRTFGTIVEHQLTHTSNWLSTIADLRGAMPDLPWNAQPFVSAVDALCRKLQTLHESGRNGMWWNLLTNALAPAFESRFDVVVGNPPWVSWQTLPEKYRTDNEDLWLLYRLHPEIAPGRRQRSSRAPLDLSMLFVAVSVDRYLRDSGRLAFLINASVFQSELAGRGFRARTLPPHSRYSITRIEDLSRIRVFADAANITSIVVARRRPSRSRRIPTVTWIPQGRATVTTRASLDEAIANVRRLHISAEPVDPRDERSPLLMLPDDALQASVPLRKPSVYGEAIRKGVDTRGANGILFVDILERVGSLVRVRNEPARGRLDGVPKIDGLVEADAVRLLVRGEDVSRECAQSELGVLFFHDEEHASQGLSEREAEELFPKAVAFARRFKRFLQGRRTFRNFDPRGDRWLGMYSVTSAVLSRDKVVVREIASDFVAAPLAGTQFVPDHKLYVIPCLSADEAERLSYVLNSDPVRAIVRGSSVRTSFTGSFLRYVGIRTLENDRGYKMDDDWLASALGLSSAELRAMQSSIAAYGDILT
ncbi:MAG TPA: N-6 DNA methylase [Candidatus Baltobacteraceae bacterium]|nr:N-6 DNA methylase [Candidatus Baltobacteraceae bacterium]